MKKALLLLVLTVTFVLPAMAQEKGSSPMNQAIVDLVANYSKARDTQDTLLLRRILTDDVDQLVSSGEWRNGMAASMAGMVQSTDSNPGTRTLEVDKVRFITKQSALADARYIIRNPDGTVRNMWSTFVAVKQRGQWKIAAIRNMLPASAK